MATDRQHDVRYAVPHNLHGDVSMVQDQVDQEVVLPQELKQYFNQARAFNTQVWLTSRYYVRDTMPHALQESSLELYE